ncbi:hypothetical protein DMENIID0001_103700 [Sergentomyia squamirostris]
MSISKAARQFNIPRTTVFDKLEGKSPLECMGRPGFHSTLGKTTEDELVAWINNSNERGLYISRDGLLTSIQKIMSERKPQRRKLFRNCKPSKRFFYPFQNRHPELKWKTEAHRKRDKLTEAAVKLWLKNVDSQLGENAKILGCPERVFSVELLVFACPERHLILKIPKKGDKELVSTLFAANANGIFMTPQTFYMAQRLPAKAHKVPPGWKISKTESGYITPSAFYDYFTSTFVTFLTDNKVQRPVIVYIDGQKSNLTFHLKKFCDEQKILLVPLCPEASHILHPLNVTLFESIRNNWMSARTDIEDANATFMTKYNLPTLLNMFMMMDGRKEDLIHKFKTTGLCPLKSDCISEVFEGFEDHQASSTSRKRETLSSVAQSMEVDYEDPLNSEVASEASTVDDNEYSVNSDLISEDSEVDCNELNSVDPKVPEVSQAPEVPHCSQHHPAMKILELELGALESHLSFFEKRIKLSLLSEFRKTKAKAQSQWKGEGKCTELYNVWRGIVIDVEEARNRLRVNT